ncbi:D-tyrosyl-tRNA(Tyr) deacylase [SAR202 cluster bacterium AD-804-J14_MRT_500m]|nr:D-tyrosyl-tRNA(Tyr) deacylase [SAR202 cluster bacterium AD-804-J14_MRT_500m]
MRVLLQRVTTATVTIEGQIVSQISNGLVVMLGVSKNDAEEDTKYVVDRTVNMRLFPNQDGRFDLSAINVQAELLVISQFTLYANTRKGRRPDFTSAAPPDAAEFMYEKAVKMFKETGLTTKTGMFRKHMLVSIQNDGPVTITIDSADRLSPRRK